jgi:hypothetical protein
MNLQKVYEVKVLNQTPAEHGALIGTVIVHFSVAAFQVMAGRRQDPDAQASKIAKNLVLGPGAHMNSGTRIEHPTVDLDALGQPTAYPDDADTRAWVRSA